MGWWGKEYGVPDYCGMVREKRYFTGLHTGVKL